MGTMYAAGLVEAVTDGMTSLEQALAIQFQSNFYPPLPIGYVAPTIEALDAINAGEPKKLIQLPDGIVPIPRYVVTDENGMFVNADYLIQITRTEGFLSDNDTDY